MTAKEALRRAAAKSEGAPLRSVNVIRMRTEMSSSTASHIPEEWGFLYQTETGGPFCVIICRDSVRVSADGTLNPESRHKPPISNWVFDSNEAVSKARQFGARPMMHHGVSLWSLTMSDVDGIVAPVWQLSDGLMGHPVCIRADTGTAVFIRRGVAPLSFTAAVPPDIGASFHATAMGQSSPANVADRPSYSYQDSSSHTTDAWITADRDRNHDHQKRLEDWKKLPLWRRLLSKRPKHPMLG